MKTNIKPLQTSTTYHIFNRGINGDSIFREEKNYFYFLRLYAKYIPAIAETYAYCLLGNHFHFLIKTKNETEIIEALKNTQNRKRSIEIDDASYHISNQFSKLFNSYAQAYNKMYNRTGALFENPYRRITVCDDKYFTQLIYYIHANPSKHGISEDFTQYPYSSYSAYILDKKTQLNKTEVLDWFGNKQEFIHFHTNYKYESKLVAEHLDF